MGYSRAGGACEGAVLIFAHNIKEAKKIGFYAMSGMITDEYIDTAVNLIREEFIYEQAPEWSKKKLADGIPHVVDNPLSCKGCNLWGYELNEDGYCEDCQAERDGDT